MSFKSYLQKKQASPKSIRSHEYNINRFEAWLMEQGLDIKVVDQKEILAYLQYCKSKGNGNRTLSHYLNSLNQYFTYLKVKPNPCLHLKIKGIAKRLPSGLLSEKELAHLHRSYPQSTIHEKRDRLMLSLLIYQGITTAELIELKVEDVELSLGIMEVRTSRQGQYRKLKLLDHQIIDLENYLKNIRPKLEKASGMQMDQLIINSGKSERKDKLKNTLQEIVKRLQKRHSYFKNARQLRASRIALWLNQYNLRQVQYMAGHRYISSTERYRMDKVEDLQRELGKYHPRK